MSPHARSRARSELAARPPPASDEVLSTLEQDRVEALLVPERSTLKAGLCPTCGRLSTDGGRRCPLDGAVLAEVEGYSRRDARAPWLICCLESHR